jgi:hypothetical protein
VRVWERWWVRLVHVCVCLCAVCCFGCVRGVRGVCVWRIVIGEAGGEALGQ